MTLLYHYCSSASFKAIIDSNSLHLSALNMSNDTLEGKWIIERIKEMTREMNVDEEEKEKILELIDNLSNAYVFGGFCLSKYHDLLSQWTRYADDGKGFCIGFDKKGLENLIEYNEPKNHKHHDEYVFSKVFYDPDNYPEEFAEDVRNICDSDNDYQRKSILINNIFLKYGILLKHHSFREENEYRIAVSMNSHYSTEALDDNCDFKWRESSIIPFLTLKSNDREKLPIKDIYIGPRNSSRILYLQSFLKKLGYEDLYIDRYDAPYRGSLY